MIPPLRVIWCRFPNGLEKQYDAYSHEELKIVRKLMIEDGAVELKVTSGPTSILLEWWGEEPTIAPIDFRRAALAFCARHGQGVVARYCGVGLETVKRWVAGKKAPLLGDRARLIKQMREIPGDRIVLFDGERRQRDAIAHAGLGGQALHVWNRSGRWKRLARAPPFRRYFPWAHLFDQDRERLIRTAKELGVRVIAVERIGEPGQHIDLCGGPLSKAIGMSK